MFIWIQTTLTLMGKQAQRVVIIDDDEFNNKITRITLEKVLGENSEIITYENAQAGLDDIKKNPHTDERIIFLLDLNMPERLGFSLVDELAKIYGGNMKGKYIYVISSSIDKADMQRARVHPHVLHYLIKPLTRETVRLVVHSTAQK